MNGLQQQQPLVCVLVLNYNGAHFLTGCLQSLLDSHYSNLRIYLVDNGSTDQSVPLVRSHFPHVGIIEMKQNVGFSVAYNRATNVVDGDYYLFLNNDVILESNTIFHLVQVADSADDIAAATPKMLFYHDKRVINGCGGTLDRFAFGLNIGIGEIDQGQYENPMEVFYAIGAAMMVKARIWKRVGGFDERFFAYYEDSDWSWRARLLGYRIMYAPTIVYHKWRGSWTDIRRRMYYQERHRLASILKNYSTRTLAYLLPLYCGLALLRITWVSLNWGLVIGLSMAAGDLWNLKELGGTLEARTQIQRNRLLDDAQIFKVMAPSSLELAHRKNRFLTKKR